ncbi:MAG TPA: flagellar motor protein MotB [Pyrinomonadaceae bacterium]|jgi:chemotaxis protein MotB|nr:flagellar motor protein MotB [Pyrinomonadaceae bacterium]
MPEQNKKPRRRIKKVAGHGGHHGGAWKVAYADFVTAMMALFLVLWLVSQADTKLKQAIAQYFRSPGVFDTQRGGILEGPKQVSKEPTSMTSKEEEQALFSIAKMLKKEFATRPEFSAVKDQVKIDVTAEGLRIQIVDKAERVSFASGSSTLTAEAKAVLAEIAHGICQLPNPIIIGGHTDRRNFGPGSTYTNWELSTDRANAARRELEANCVKPETVVRVVGHADTEPLIPADPYAPSNRRISITVMRVGAGATPAVAAEEDEEAGEKHEGKKPASGEKDEERDGHEADDSAGEGQEVTPKKTSTEEGKKPAAESHGEKSHSPETAPPAAGGKTCKSEQNLLKSRLASEGSVKVGEADQLPLHATRSREAKPAH